MTVTQHLERYSNNHLTYAKLLVILSGVDRVRPNPKPRTSRIGGWVNLEDKYNPLLKREKWMDERYV